MYPKLFDTYKGATLYNRIFMFVREFRHNVKYSCQRAVRGWSDLDARNMRDYLLAIIPDMLDYLADRCVSTPFYLSEEEWYEILCTMSKMFKDIDYDAPDVLANKTLDKTHEALELLEHYFADLWD